MAWDPNDVQRLEAQSWVSQQRSTVGHTDGEGYDWIKRMAQRQPRKEDVIRSLLESMKQDEADKETKGLASL